MKREDQMRPYDPKKSVWVPTESHDFKEGLLESDDGTKAVVQVGHEVSHFKTCKNHLLGEAPCSSGERCGLTIQAMVFGRGFESQHHLKTRWMERWSTRWQKNNKRQ